MCLMLLTAYFLFCLTLKLSHAHPERGRRFESSHGAEEGPVVSVGSGAWLGFFFTSRVATTRFGSLQVVRVPWGSVGQFGWGFDRNRSNRQCTRPPKSIDAGNCF